MTPRCDGFAPESAAARLRAPRLFYSGHALKTSAGVRAFRRVYGKEVTSSLPSEHGSPRGLQRQSCSQIFPTQGGCQIAGAAAGRRLAQQYEAPASAQCAGQESGQTRVGERGAPGERPGEGGGHDRQRDWPQGGGARIALGRERRAASRNRRARSRNRGGRGDRNCSGVDRGSRRARRQLSPGQSFLTTTRPAASTKMW
jgi:hypothetical protein